MNTNNHSSSRNKQNEYVKLFSILECISNEKKLWIISTKTQTRQTHENIWEKKQTWLINMSRKKKAIIEKHCMLWLIYTYKFTHLCSNIEDLPKTNRQSNWELILTYRIDWNIFLWIHCWYWMYGECNEYWYTEYGYN